MNNRMFGIKKNFSKAAPPDNVQNKLLLGFYGKDSLACTALPYCRTLFID